MVSQFLAGKESPSENFANKTSPLKISWGGVTEAWYKVFYFYFLLILAISNIT